MTTAPISATAPGKVILFGEHAVVYGQPAIAAPVMQVQATATVEPSSEGSGLTIVASDLSTRITLGQAPQDEPLAVASRLTIDRLCAAEPDAILTVRSTIPIASGLGSGAAVSTALVRALANYLGQPLQPGEISDLVYEVERIHHGTPSGIDNTVVAYEEVVYFVREQPITRLSVGESFTLLVADTGKPSPTGEIVGRVRRAWKRERAHYDALFDQIGETAEDARDAIDSNHELLIELGVSSPVLDELAETARLAGAIGAKLSGAGQGGNMIALVEDDDTGEQVADALREAGAARVILTQVR
jgi:mevalonate kinase